MRVNVTAYGDVQRQVKDVRELELPSTATLADLLTTLGVPLDSQLTLGVNGELAALDSELHDGDKVMLVTPMEGGSAHA